MREPKSQAARRLRAHVRLDAVDEEEDDDGGGGFCFSLRRLFRWRKKKSRFEQPLAPAVRSKDAAVKDALRRMDEQVAAGEAKVTRYRENVAKLTQEALAAKQRGDVAEAKRLLGRRAIASRTLAQFETIMQRTLQSRGAIDQLETTQDIVTMQRAIVAASREIVGEDGGAALRDQIHDAFSDLSEVLGQVDHVNGLMSAAIQEDGAERGADLDEEALEAEFEALGAAAATVAAAPPPPSDESEEELEDDEEDGGVAPRLPAAPTHVPRKAKSRVFAS